MYLYIEYAQGHKTNKQRASLIRKKGYSKKIKTKNKEDS